MDEEIQKKILSRKTSSDELMKHLFEKLEDKRISPRDLSKVGKLYEEFLLGSRFNQENAEYLSHPIRVTASYVDYLKQVTYEDVALGLCHNLKEKLGDEYQKVSDEFVPRSVKSAIEVLTIDRRREKDHAYLKEFYDGIEQAGKNLMLLKALDKLDNTLIWVLLDLESYHAEIVLNFVCPRIAKSYPGLERYLRTLTQYVVTEKAKNQFRSFVIPAQSPG